MNAADFKPCAFCRKGVMHTGLPLFWRVSIERMGIDVTKARAQAGLELMLGSVALARAMGDAENIAAPLPDSLTSLLVCEACAVERSLPLAAMAEAS